MELAISVFLLLILVFGAIDFARAIYYVEVIKNLTGEGSSMASRGTSLLQTAQTVVTDAGTNLSLSSQGCVIVTSVLKTAGVSNPLQVTGQSAPQGACTGISSKIGCYPPAGNMRDSHASSRSRGCAPAQPNALHHRDLLHVQSRDTDRELVEQQPTYYHRSCMTRLITEEGDLMRVAKEETGQILIVLAVGPLILILFMGLADRRGHGLYHESQAVKISGCRMSYRHEEPAARAINRYNLGHPHI